MAGTDGRPPIMPTVNIQEAQAKLPELIHGLSPGTEVVITENDQPVAKLVAEKPVLGRRPGPGLCKELVTIVVEDEDHLHDFGEYMP
jgi:antitoxin (DNA-binding transcriptional repressor) of toxin-antitoxin stability system